MPQPGREARSRSLRYIVLTSKDTRRLKIQMARQFVPKYLDTDELEKRLKNCFGSRHDFKIKVHPLIGLLDSFGFLCSKYDPETKITSWETPTEEKLSDVSCVPARAVRFLS